MAQFSLEIASETMQLYSDNYKELSAFLKITEIIHNKLATEARSQFIEYTFFRKLSPNVQNSLISIDNPKTL